MRDKEFELASDEFIKKCKLTDILIRFIKEDLRKEIKKEPYGPNPFLGYPDLSNHQKNSRYISLPQAKYEERRKYFLNFIIDNCWDGEQCKYTASNNVIKEMNEVLSQEFPIEHNQYIAKFS